MNGITAFASRHKTAVRVCVLLLPVLLILIMLAAKPLIALIGENMPPCAFRERTGLYCPGCGMTRSCLALADGNILLSLRYHPLPVIAVILCLLLYIELLLSAFDKKVRILPRSPVFWAVTVSAFLLFMCARSFIPSLWPV